MEGLNLLRQILTTAVKETAISQTSAVLINGD